MRSKILSLLLFGILVYLLFWRWQVSATRVFDVDEFSYMHWAAMAARGERPYIDFFSYFTPGFMWAFAPIFWIWGVSVQVFTAGRIVSFVIFLSILSSLSYLWGITRGWKWALLPAVILAFLPMPYDKFLEIRPDNLATLLAVIGVIGEIWAIRVRKKTWWWVLSGLAYSASLFVLAKTLPIVAVGAGVALLSSPKKFVYFLFGLLGPWILFFLGAAVSGHFGVVWYSLTTLPLEVYKSPFNFTMQATLFFYPNDWFYGGDSQSISPGLIVNHAIWIAALLVGTYRLVTSVRFIELLVAGVFFVSVFAYDKLFPLKHSQYLIPIAVFVAYYAADGLASLFEWLARAGGSMSLAIVLAGFGYLLIAVTKDVNAPKLLNTNAMQRKEFALLLRTVPLSARVVDLEGRMVFWPDGYPISSLPFDGFLPFLSRPPLPLREYLAKYPAQYIYDGESNRMAILAAENLSFIRAYYAPVPGFGGRLWARK
jgi:hypothetical protein